MSDSYYADLSCRLNIMVMRNSLHLTDITGTVLWAELPSKANISMQQRQLRSGLLQHSVHMKLDHISLCMQSLHSMAIWINHKVHEVCKIL